MALVPFAVLWLAYQFGWYGFTTIYPVCGVGFTDLILPNRMVKVDQYLAASMANKSANAALCGTNDCGPGGTPTGDGGCVSPGIPFTPNPTPQAPTTPTQQAPNNSGTILV